MPRAELPCWSVGQSVCWVGKTLVLQCPHYILTVWVLFHDRMKKTLPWYLAFVLGFAHHRHPRGRSSAAMVNHPTCGTKARANRAASFSKIGNRKVCSVSCSYHKFKRVLSACTSQPFHGACCVVGHSVQALSPGWMREAQQRSATVFETSYPSGDPKHGHQNHSELLTRPKGIWLEISSASLPLSFLKENTKN